MDVLELKEKFPFLTCIKYASQEFIGVIQNSDQIVTSMYVYDNITSPELKKVFLDMGEMWWWESNRLIPINIFLSGDFDVFNHSLKNFVTKDLEVVFGPMTSMQNVIRKRIKRRQISLVNKTVKKQLVQQSDSSEQE
tara:strand:+ start:21915 stop:22325 length:411 start_codon:yes stop_codon:yes gene_type:complete